MGAVDGATTRGKSLTFAFVTMWQLQEL